MMMMMMMIMMTMIIVIIVTIRTYSGFLVMINRLVTPYLCFPTCPLM